MTPVPLPCDLFHDACDDVTYPNSPPTSLGQTHTSENITFLQLLLRAVITINDFGAELDAPCNQWWIQNFPDGAWQLQTGANLLFGQIFSKKLHENERSWTEGRETPLILTSSGGHCSGRYASCWNAFLFEPML